MNRDRDTETTEESGKRDGRQLLGERLADSEGGEDREQPDRLPGRVAVPEVAAAAKAGVQARPQATELRDRVADQEAESVQQSVQEPLQHDAANLGEQEVAIGHLQSDDVQSEENGARLAAEADRQQHHLQHDQQCDQQRDHRQSACVEPEHDDPEVRSAAEPDGRLLEHLCAAADLGPSQGPENDQPGDVG